MDTSAHLTHHIQEELGHKFYRVKNDVYGNPRYVIHFLAFAQDYDKAHKIANKLGFRVYRGRDFGGGFVCQSYNIEQDAERIINEREVA